ncbi:DMP19 family protein [Cytophagaceae bacterium DM2B3-1]|uniref:DMP19 family protein n=1 Tax=Xanthocytophaga flava TaxID=3048013 RepID=A0ABT7CM43_9BACT|nr:DMP19 family protein [Xanthocytophaga flavus]MDJ1494819.1 DMP19 family protein [Xanthocytophaga flavus]
MKKREKREWEYDMENLVHSFLNRTIYEKLTKHIIASIPDEALVQAIIDNIQTKISPDFSDEYDVVTKLSAGRQAVYAIFYLECEVCNGGFSQFFYNSISVFAEDALYGLERIGAVKLSALMKQAISLYKENKKEITEIEDETIEGYHKFYSDNPLNKLDDIFYLLIKEENLSDLIINYIRNNLNEFVD